MKVLDRGHKYELEHRDGSGKTVIQYVDKEPGTEKEGVISQEVLRMLIDRTRYCNNCLPHPNNERIIYHLRMALVLHESRALERKVEKSIIKPEYVPTGEDGHYKIPVEPVEVGEVTSELDPYRPDWDRQCKYERQ